MAEAEKPVPNQKLRFERERRAWSQQEVADKVGTTPLNVGRWERGITVPSPYFRQKLCEVFEKSPYDLGLVAERQPALPLSEPPPTPGKPTAVAETSTLLWNVPYGRNIFFTGREEVLDHLRMALSAQAQPIAISQPQAISGLGGIGKTQTAVEYAYRYRDDYTAVFWARAESPDLLVSDYLTIAALLDLPERNEKDQNVQVKAVLRWFDTHQGWLLILDNADDLEMASTFIPSSGNGHVLLTTRAFSTGTVAGRIELDTMTVEEGMLFLLRRIKRIRGNTTLESIPESVWSHTRAIVEAVDALPLALDQAGAYIEETGTGLADYLKLYRTRRHRLLRMRGQSAGGHPEPVATTWSLSFEKIKQANPAAAELLCLLSLLHPDSIPESMIFAGADALGPVLQPVVSDEFDFNEALGALHKYSLIKRDREEKLIAIHRLVQAVVWDGLDKETQQLWAERTVRVVNRAFPVGAFTSWSICQQYLPHAQVCLELIGQWNIMLSEAAQLLSRVGNYLRQRAQYREAELFLQKALQIRKQISGPDQLDVATDMNDLAGTRVDMGKYAQAEELYLSARNIRERVLGFTHPDVATTINDLGMLYREQGKFAQAEALYEEALAIRLQTLGPEHYDVAVSYNNLAMVLDDQGKYTRVEALYKQALAIWERLFGPEHPDVGQGLNNIGWHYYRQGKYDQAEAIHLKALALFEKALGANHPYTALSINALGLLYWDLGKDAQAESFLQRALEIREKALEPGHVDVAQSLYNLGRFYRIQGNYALAESLLQRALRIWEQQGPDSALVSYSLNALAKLYRDQARYDEAEPLFQRAIAIDERAYGRDSLDVSYGLVALAVLYHRQGRYDEAELLFQRALPIQERILDAEHIEVAVCLSSLAALYRDERKFDQAEPLFQRALSIQEKALGSDHPAVATSLNGLANLYRDQGEYEQAEPLYQRALTIRQQQRGAQHIETAESLHDFARFYEMRNQPEQALTFYRQALAIREQQLGPQHPFTVDTRTHAARLLRECGRIEEAIALEAASTQEVMTSEQPVR